MVQKTGAKVLKRAFVKRRVRYLPNLYHRPTPSSQAKASTSSKGKSKPKERPWCLPKAREGTLEFGEATDALEVWFAGCHSGE
jgi:hypothetical protein